MEPVYTAMGVDTDKVFEYLVALRDSGITNMWFAAPFIEDQFDVSESESRRLLVAWIQSFATENGSAP